MVVVGTQNQSLMAAGHTSSSKERKALVLIEKGQQIKLITEHEFLNIIG